MSKKVHHILIIKYFCVHEIIAQYPGLWKIYVITQKSIVAYFEDMFVSRNELLVFYLMKDELFDTSDTYTSTKGLSK